MLFRKTGRTDARRKPQRGKKPRKFGGLEPRDMPKKAWPSDKPPGGKLPPEVQSKSANPPDKPPE